jgi:excisionase family DNA binding protein
MANNSEQLVSVAYAAQRLNVHKQTVRRWVREGKLLAFATEAHPQKMLLRESEVARMGKPRLWNQLQEGTH